MPETIDWPMSSRPRSLKLLVYLLFAVVILIFIGGRTAISYWVDLLWFRSLGFAGVFWKTFDLEWGTFAAFAVLTFLILFAAFLALRHSHASDLPDTHTIFVAGRPFTLPVLKVLRIVAIVGALIIALATGFAMQLQWPTLALYWYAPHTAANIADPIFGRPLDFYLFTLPAWQLIAGWLLTLAVLVSILAVIFFIAASGGQALEGRFRATSSLPWRGVSIAAGFLLLALAVHEYVGRFGLLFGQHTIFAGVTYTDAHVNILGMSLISAAFAIGAVIVFVAAVAQPRARWLIVSIAPAAVCFVAFGIAGWYVDTFIVKPNQLDRERPYIADNIAFTRQAYGLDRFDQREFPAETTVAAADPEHNQATLENIRLWDVHALHDTLRQVQAIRTYYDFPGIDIDRYRINGSLREVMLAVRELNVDLLPESSHNWINDKLIYTHGYGITMNPVNGFTPEGLPNLYLSNMPVQSTVPGLEVTRPEIYFGELTNNDVYVKTHQQEFNYPQGQTNSLSSYEGTGGIAMGGFFRRLLIAFDRGDLTKVPFSDDITAESRLLMRRNVLTRVQALAPFLTFDQDPYIVVGGNGHLLWIVDGFTSSNSYPYSAQASVQDQSLNYMRNSVKAVVDAYDGTVTFYVFDNQDPVLAAWRGIFPSLFKDASTMPAWLRAHVRYPELLLSLQAQMYGLYHMTDPEVFYNREDQWSVATETSIGPGRSIRAAHAPQFRAHDVARRIKRPGIRRDSAFHPHQPQQHDWMDRRAQRRRELRQSRCLRFSQVAAGRRSAANRGAHRSERAAFRPAYALESAGFTRHSRQPARDSLRACAFVCGADLSSGAAQPHARAAAGGACAAGPARLRAGLRFGAQLPLRGPGAVAHRASGAAQPAAETTASSAAHPSANLNTLITQASRDFADYQRLTSEGKLAEAGQKLDDLKRVLGELNANAK